MSEKIPAYLDRARLCAELDIAERTLDNWIAKGFPKPGRHGKWRWAKVERYMEVDDEPAVASAGLDKQAEEIRNASKNYFAIQRRDVRRRPARVRNEPELHPQPAEHAGELSPAHRLG